MQLSQAIESLLLATKANGRSPETIKDYEEKLRHLLDALGDVSVETITVHDLRGYVAAQQERTLAYKSDNPPPGALSPFTVAGRVRVLKRLFNFLIDDEVLETNPARRIHFPKPKRGAPKGIVHGDLLILLKSTLNGGILDLRDRAIMLFLADTGCRVGGLCGLRMDDVNLAELQAVVTEKGEKTRVVNFVEMTADALRAWLAARPEVTSDALFLSMNRWGQFKGPLTRITVARMLNRRAENAGIEGKVNPHSFRHAFARDFLMSGGDLGSLCDIMGHSSVLVTKEFYGVLTASELRSKHRQHSPITQLFSKPEEESEV